MNNFTENKFYVMTGNGQKWSDYDGPFDTPEEGCELLHQLCGGDYSVPEIINSAVLTHFRDNMLHLVKDDTGDIVNGKAISWNKSIYIDQKLVWEKNDAHNP